MLTLKERKRVLSFFHYCSIICVFPVRVQVQSWDIRSGKETKWQLWLCRGSYGLFIAHASYKFIRLIHAIFFCPQVPLPQMMIHGDLAFGSLTAVYWYYLQYIDHADVNAGFVRMTLTGNIGGGRTEAKSHCRPSLDKFILIQVKWLLRLNLMRGLPVVTYGNARCRTRLLSWCLSCPRGLQCSLEFVFSTILR